MKLKFLCHYSQTQQAVNGTYLSDKRLVCYVPKKLNDAVRAYYVFKESGGYLRNTQVVVEALDRKMTDLYSDWKL